MAGSFRFRRSILGLVLMALVVFIITVNAPMQTETPIKKSSQATVNHGALALDALEGIAIKGRAPKTDYSRQQFGSGWEVVGGCDMRNIILHRDMPDAVVDAACNVISGTLNDPYTGKVINFVRGSTTSADVQIDHVVALSDAWQKGAQQLTPELRKQLANDPLELLAVDGDANQQKSDGDAATWLPPNKSFRCEYVARQIAIKVKYTLWVTQSEHDVIAKILSQCRDQAIPDID